MGQEDLMNTAEDVADQVTSILARQLFALAAASMLAANYFLWRSNGMFLSLSSIIALAFIIVSTGVGKLTGPIGMVSFPYGC